jgi:hypothetical protein
MFSYFFTIKPIRCTNFTNLFWHETLQFRTVRLSIIRSLFTIHSAMVYSYVIQVCRQLSSRTILVLLDSCLQTCTTYTIAECTVNKLLIMDRRTVRNCRVSRQNKFVKLVHLVCFIINKFVTMQHGHMNVKFSHLLQNIPSHNFEGT